MWDYIIVGAGTAGCVLADELTVTGRNRVLLVEAGGKPTLTVAMPAGMVKLFKSKQDWALESEPQSACGGRRIYIPRGRMLGGSANINAQIHQWCHPADFDGWAESGAEGWAWRDVAPVFRAMENCTCAEEDDQSRGKLGPMHIARPTRADPLADAFVQAARRAGINGTESYNGVAYRGAWLSELAHRNGRRFSVYDAHLRPAMRRSNLEVRTYLRIDRILFEDRRATAILAADGSEMRATRGIILSAGAFGTPHLLMLSGIGPEQQLRRHGIRPLADQPGIGENLQDHPLAGIKFATRRPVTMKSAESLRQLFSWLILRRGMLASNGVEAIAFTNVLGGDAPDLELVFAALEWREQALEPPQVHAYTIGSSPCAPRSRGTVSLRSPSPGDPPAIDFGLLSDPDGIDARVLLAGARLARKIAATQPLAAETAGELADSASAQSDEDLLAYLKSQIQTVYHPCGTCRMGNNDAPVDRRLKLRGVDSLWVADASVMPAIPRGHPNSVVAMIAKRAAGWIEQGDANRIVTRQIRPKAELV